MRLVPSSSIALCILLAVTSADAGSFALGKLDPESFTSFPVEHGRTIQLVALSDSGGALFAGGDGLVLVGHPNQQPRSLPLAIIPLGASHTGAVWIAADTSGLLVLPDAREPTWLPLKEERTDADHPAWIGVDSPCAGSPGCPMVGPRWPAPNQLHTPDVTYIDLPGRLVALAVDAPRVLWEIEHEGTPFMSASWITNPSSDSTLVRTVQARSELTLSDDGSLQYRGQLSERTGDSIVGYGFSPGATLMLTIAPNGSIPDLLTSIAEDRGIARL